MRHASSVRFAILLLLPCLWSPCAWAEDVATGSRVRLIVPDLQAARFEGRLVETSDSTVTVHSKSLIPPQQSVRRAAIESFEVSHGERSKTMRNAGIGALVGIGLGVVVGLASGDDDADIVSFSAGDKAVIAGIGLGAIGFLLGAISGMMTYEETWRPVDADRVRMVVTSEGKPGLAFAFRF